MFTCCHFINIQLRAIFRNEMLKQVMRLLQFLFKFCFAFIGIFAKHGYCTFELTCCIEFKIDVFFFQ